MTQFLRDQASDSEEVVTPLMLDGTYLSRNFATLGPLPDSRRVLPHFHFGTAVNLISFKGNTGHEGDQGKARTQG